MMPEAGTPWDRARRAFARFWRSQNPRVALARDIATTGLVFFLLLSAVWIYAGQPLSRAPVVSVESGSMMHGPHRSGDESMPTGWGMPPFGRIGTIDPGDIVLVKRVKDASDVETAFGLGRRSGYGAHGDVIVFQRDGSDQTTRVIHRAILHVEANREGCQPNVDCIYRIPTFCDEEKLSAWAGPDSGLEKYCEGSADPLQFRIERGGIILDLTADPLPCAPLAVGCDPFYSGFITRGDNNRAHDQANAGRITDVVRLEWVIGKARGEIPWFGLVKLALYGNDAYATGTDPTKGANWRVLQARAPWDICLSLYLSVAVLLAAPAAFEWGRKRWARRKDAPPAP